MDGSGERLAAVSVDLDEIGCYAQIHGVDARAAGASLHAVYDRCVARFARLFEDEGIPATFFVIGQDLAREEAAAAVRALSAAGHEIGNHSLSHLYDLTRRSRGVIRAEIAGGIDAVARVTGRAPAGFRAPGYTVTDAVFDVLAELRVAYDSSVFPCPAYYAAKASAIMALAARSAVGLGRPSRSIVDHPAVLSAPADPYRVGRPYWRRGDRLVELPIAVTRGARLPFIGTSVAMGGETAARVLARQCVGRPLVNFELHGIDLADAEEDGLGWLRPHQPDLRRPRASKERALRTAIGALRDAGYRFVTLAEAAARVR
jgi:peptidoglycan/xylan/chitin deacetylase (PgdA/CDA1 family)